MMLFQCAIGGWSKATFRIVMTLVLVAIGVCGSCVEALTLGPYTVWFNTRMKQKVIDSVLIGRPESEIEPTLGRATERYEVVSSSPPGVIYDYYPYPWWPFAKFQVFAEDGIVTGYELFDD